MVVLCHVNVRSLMAPGRLTDLQMLSSFNNIDILCITETWLKPNHLNSSILIPGFQPPLRKDRLSSRGGGVAIYLRNGLTAKLLPLPLPRLECLSVQLHFPKRKKLTLHVVYRPPNLPMESFLDDLEETVAKCNGHICLVGDFNAKHSLWYPGQRTDNDGEALKSFSDGNQLYQIVTSPTYNTTDTKYNPTLLDLAFTNHPSSVQSHTVLPPVADHCPVLLHLSFKNLLKKNRLPSQNTCTAKQIFLNSTTLSSHSTGGQQ